MLLEPISYNFFGVKCTPKWGIFYSTSPFLNLPISYYFHPIKIMIVAQSYSVTMLVFSAVIFYAGISNFRLILRWNCYADPSSVKNNSPVKLLNKIKGFIESGP